MSCLGRKSYHKIGSEGKWLPYREDRSLGYPSSYSYPSAIAVRGSGNTSRIAALLPHFKLDHFTNRHYHDTGRIMDAQQFSNWTEPAIAHALQVATIWKYPIAGIICIVSPIPILILSCLILPRCIPAAAELAAAVIWFVWTCSYETFADALVHEGLRLPLPGLGLHATLIPQVLPNTCAEATVVEGPGCYPCGRDEMMEEWENATGAKIWYGSLCAVVLLLCIYFGYLHPYFYPSESTEEEAESDADLEKGVEVCG